MGEEVQRMFQGIAPRYDRANAILSFGLHGRWRRAAVAASLAAPGSRVLDVATGTGDLAFEFCRRVGAEGRVVGVDFVAGMLLLASRKGLRKRHRQPTAWVAGDALRLPLPDDAFDVASIAFGIRNVDDPVAGLREMARCVRPGGAVVVLEFGQPRGPFGWAYRWYARHVIPRVGGWVTGNRAAYDYLPRTAAAFPAGDAFVALMDRTGAFTGVRARRLLGGIVWLYVGTVASP